MVRFRSLLELGLSLYPISRHISSSLSLSESWQEGREPCICWRCTDLFFFFSQEFRRLRAHRLENMIIDLPQLSAQPMGYECSSSEFRFTAVCSGRSMWTFCPSWTEYTFTLMFKGRTWKKTAVNEVIRRKWSDFK